MTTARCALGVALLLWAAAARAQAAEPASWRQPLTERELSEIRGGFLTADGVTFAFGVSLQTFVDGQLALATSLNVTGDGAPTRSVATPDLAALGQSAHSALLSLGSNVANTTLLQQIGGGSVQNIIATSASNQVLSQSTNLTLTLAGFQQNQASYQVGQVLSNITSQLNFAMSTVRH